MGYVRVPFGSRQATTWSSTGGTIQSGGLYTAGPTAGSYRVIGTATGTTFADTADGTVGSSGVWLTQLILNPSSATVPVGTSRQFSVTGLYSDGSTSTPLVTWSATGGSVTAGGLYTVGTVQGTFRIIAREASGKADTSAITVAPPALTQLVLNPSAVTLKPGEARTFSVSGLWSDGSTATPVVTYAAQGGTISAAGVYSAGLAQKGP